MKQAKEGKLGVFMVKIEDLITIKEHITNIFNYKNYDVLDRDDAIEKYKKFNREHPNYNKWKCTICGTLIPFEQASNEIIVNNIYSQLLYLYR